MVDKQNNTDTMLYNNIYTTYYTMLKYYENIYCIIQIRQCELKIGSIFDKLAWRVNFIITCGDHSTTFFSLLISSNLERAEINLYLKTFQNSQHLELFRCSYSTIQLFCSMH